jgi:hypothetical protein
MFVVGSAELGPHPDLCVVFRRNISRFVFADLVLYFSPPSNLAPAL